VTILGGLLVGLGGVAAAEFSFLLGLVTLTAASAYEALKIVKAGELPQFVAAMGGWLPILCGLATAWAAAALAVDFLVAYLQRHTLAIFGWWRLAVAAIVVVLCWQFGLTLTA
jgi:undecaprenyl-diphosphatase